MSCVFADKDYPNAKPKVAAAVVEMKAGEVTEPVPMPWRLYIPSSGSAENPLPLVVFLHGAGKRGDDNVGPMALAYGFFTEEAQAQNPCFVFAPQVRKGRRWVDQNFNAGSYNSEEVKATDEMATMLAMVDRLLTEYPIDPKRVYVVGQSMGGYGTWDAMVRRPDLWAAGVPICGAGDPGKAEAISHIPIWVCHGEKDNAVPVSGSREMVEALNKAGGSVHYVEIPGGGHGVWGKVFSDPEFYAWLFAQKQP